MTTHIRSGGQRVARPAGDERFDDGPRFVGRRRGGEPGAGRARHARTPGEKGQKAQAYEAFVSHTRAEMLRHTSTLLAAVTLLLLSAPSRAEHPREKPGEILAEGLSLDAGTLLLAENSGNAGKLRPEIFRRLSSAGQRAALRAAGLLPPQAARPPRAPLVGSVRPSLTPSAGQNVRVNDPSADVVG